MQMLRKMIVIAGFAVIYLSFVVVSLELLFRTSLVILMFCFQHSNHSSEPDVNLSVAVFLKIFVGKFLFSWAKGGYDKHGYFQLILFAPNDLLITDNDS